MRSINDKNQFTNNPPILNFSDVQGKALYDLNTRNQVGFSLIYGAFNFDRNRDRNLLGINQVSRADTHNLLVNGHWTFTPNPRVFWQTRVFGLRTNFENTNRNDAFLQKGHRTQYGVRSDVSFQPRPQHRIETGLYIRSLSVDSTTQFFDFFEETLGNFGSFNRQGTEQAFYAQDTWTSERV